MDSLAEVALSTAVVRALKEAENRRDELGTNDPKRAIMQDFLAECTRRLPQPDLGERPKLPDKRRDFVGRSESDDRRPSRDAAYTAMEKLTEAAWPTKSNAEKQVRKRQKQRHEAEWQRVLQCPTERSSGDDAATAPTLSQAQLAHLMQQINRQGFAKHEGRQHRAV